MRCRYTEVAHEFDKTWQKRKRIIDSMLLIFLIFHLLFPKNSYDYGTTISDFWYNCPKMNFPLPQEKPISASAFTQFLSKLDETIFKVLNNLSKKDDSTPAEIKVNFKNCLATVSKQLDEIMFIRLAQARLILQDRMCLSALESGDKIIPHSATTCVNRISMDEIMFVPANYVKDVIEQIVDSISRYRQKI